MLDGLKIDVLSANLALVREGLVLMTWGNASAIDRASGHVVIKPSGVAYDAMKAEDMVIVDLEGRKVAGSLNASVDTPTHLALYRAFPEIGGVVHTHSHYATCWAQACRSIPCFGTTHADYFHGDVPVTDSMTATEAREDYEANIGEVIIRCFRDRDPMRCPAVLVANHAPFTWGKTVAAAVENAFVLEEVARMAMHTVALSPDQPAIEDHLLDKHVLRKHGSSAYYGQGGV
ncbi:MAG: L-ribulose-5-phosphate 4-epimerase AraD [Candidatus Hydrogenedentes bacterium]|nr:L-ribulose-5-phosphate 4-epimerase AraD [Candidatus Hydrogenedentota bacterium]